MRTQTKPTIEKVVKVLVFIKYVQNMITILANELWKLPFDLHIPNRTEHIQKQLLRERESEMENGKRG